MKIKLCFEFWQLQDLAEASNGSDYTPSVDPHGTQLCGLLCGASITAEVQNPYWIYEKQRMPELYHRYPRMMVTWGLLLANAT